MSFWGSWSIFGVYFMNIIGALWIDIYIGLILAFIGLIFGISLFDLLTVVYEGMPSLKRAFFWKLVGLIANIVIGRMYYDGFKRVVAHKRWLNTASTDETLGGSSTGTAKPAADDQSLDSGTEIEFLTAF